MFGDDTLISLYQLLLVLLFADYTGYAYIEGETIEEVGTAGANVFARIYQDSTALLDHYIMMVLLLLFLM